MAEEIQVNRVSQSPGLEQDIQEIKEAEKENLKIGAVGDVGFGITVIKPKDEGSEVGITAIKPNSGLVDKQFEKEQEILETLGRNLKSAPRDPDLALFRKQVIDAFHHLGLDVRKFFG
jgi:hypothetical protein